MTVIFEMASGDLIERDLLQSEDRPREGVPVERLELHLQEVASQAIPPARPAELIPADIPAFLKRMDK